MLDCSGRGFEAPRVRFIFSVEGGGFVLSLTSALSSERFGFQLPHKIFLDQSPFFQAQGPLRPFVAENPTGMFRTNCLVMPGIAGVGCRRAGAGLSRQDLDNERPRREPPLGNWYDIF